jgi:LacI family transcriptional regulator
LTVVEEIGYKPNGAARALRSGRTHIIAWWAADCFTPFYAQVGRYVAQQSIRRHYHLMIHSRQHYVNDPLQASTFMPWRVDGVLGYDIHAKDGLLTSLYDADTPIVTLGAFHDEGSDFVGVDLYAGAVQAMQHLLHPGCRRIAYMYNEEATPARDPRSQAYRDVMREAGLEPERLRLPDHQRLHAQQAIVAYVGARGLPEAIFCINDDVALGCYRGLCDLGVRIPDDVALVGCDGLSELEFMPTPISTIVHPVEAMCEQAWDFLERRIEDSSLPLQTAIWPAQLVVRASSLR